MEAREKLLQLMRRLGVAGEEALVVPVYDAEAVRDVFLTAKAGPEGVEVEASDSFDPRPGGPPFRMASQKGPDGRHVIPSAEEMDADAAEDY